MANELLTRYFVQTDKWLLFVQLIEIIMGKSISDLAYFIILSHIMCSLMKTPSITARVICEYAYAQASLYSLGKSAERFTPKMVSTRVDGMEHGNKLRLCVLVSYGFNITSYIM